MLKVSFKLISLKEKSEWWLVAKRVKNGGHIIDFYTYY